MSWLSQAIGINIDLAHNPAAAAAALAAAASAATGATGAALVNSFVTAAGTVVAELSPTAVTSAETAINQILVQFGLANDVDAADALISAELAKLKL